MANLSRPFQLRTKPGELGRWRAAARRSAMTLSAWVRQTLDLAAVRPMPVIPPTVSGDQVELPLEGKKKTRRTA